MSGTSSAEGGRIPELKRVVVAYQNRVVMEETLDQGLVRLFGEVEASVRLPYLLFLAAGLFPGMVLLIEHGRKAASTASIWLTWAALAVFTVVMAFNATYSPYHADIALPGAAAGALLCFIPMAGEFVIPELLGGSSVQMIGRTLWSEFFQNRDWPLASA